MAGRSVVAEVLPRFQTASQETTLMRWAILIAVLAFGAARNVDGAEFSFARTNRGGALESRFVALPVAGHPCAASCQWSQFGPCPACARRMRWAYHGPYYRRPFDYRRSFDFPWSYAPYRPAAYWVSDEASDSVDVSPPPLPAPPPAR